MLYGSSADDLSSKVESNSFPFKDGGAEGYTQHHHVASMTNLIPFERFFYKVGDDTSGWSDVYQFKAVPETGPIGEPLRFGIWGDMGTDNAQILDSVKKEVEKGNFDMILHVGDFAYNMNDDEGRNGDAFMNSIQPMAATLPYMVDAGNHEAAYDFSHYTERFRNMPANAEDTPTVVTGNGEAPNNWFYSHDFGNVHFVAISTEIYFDYPDLVEAQYNFVSQDLASVDRSVTPWVIVHGHRPLYCSCDSDCDSSADTVRLGPDGKFGMEELLHSHGVDMYICGHEHNYERMYDVYNGTSTRATVNPPSTVYVVTGDAGGPEEHEKFDRPKPDRAAFRTDAYGYSRMTVFNDTHLYWEQVETDTDAGVEDVVIDETWIVVEEHGPF